MKILRKGDDFKKMPEKNIKDYLAVKSMLNAGWNYCSKAEYKKTFVTEEKPNSETTNKQTKASRKKSKK